jgi:hypothetical protein
MLHGLSNRTGGTIPPRKTFSSKLSAAFKLLSKLNPRGRGARSATTVSRTLIEFLQPHMTLPAFNHSDSESTAFLERLTVQDSKRNKMEVYRQLYFLKMRGIGEGKVSKVEQVLLDACSILETNTQYPETTCFGKATLSCAGLIMNTPDLKGIKMATVSIDTSQLTQMSRSEKEKIRASDHVIVIIPKSKQIDIQDRTLPLKKLIKLGEFLVIDPWDTSKEAIRNLDVQSMFDTLGKTRNEETILEGLNSWEQVKSKPDAISIDLESLSTKRRGDNTYDFRTLLDQSGFSSLKRKFNTKEELMQVPIKKRCLSATFYDPEELPLAGAKLLDCFKLMDETETGKKVTELVSQLSKELVFCFKGPETNLPRKYQKVRLDPKMFSLKTPFEKTFEHVCIKIQQTLGKEINTDTLVAEMNAKISSVDILTKHLQKLILGSSSTI